MIRDKEFNRESQVICSLIFLCFLVSRVGMCIIYIFCDMNVYRWCNYVLIAAKCTRKDETDTYMLEIQLNLHLRLPLVSKHPSKHKTFYSQSNHYSWNLSYINDHLCKRPRPLFEWRLKKFSVIVFIIFLQVSGPLLGRDPPVGPLCHKFICVTDVLALILHSLESIFLHMFIF